MSWSANSLDLNPIKHVWDILERQISALSHPPSSVTELKRALQEAWNRLCPQLIHNLIASMVNCCEVCLAVRVPARHGGTLNSRRTASPLVRLVEGEERWESSDHPQSVLPLNWGGIEPNRTVTCMVLKATANDRRHLVLCHDEFRGPRSGLCRSGGISNNNVTCP
ncbi:uncharacterized protein TNCV_3591451 [Trichonephila clavipes]|nr:uncharacterized protein TNCV_3591451 [Trichonephila clavipes]